MNTNFLTAKTKAHGRKTKSGKRKAQIFNREILKKREKVLTADDANKRRCFNNKDTKAQREAKKRKAEINHKFLTTDKH